IANATQCPFEKLNAVSSGVADAKRIIEQAEKHFALTGKSTFLLLDECHRWSKAQSDSVLSAIEKGYIRLIGSTTENPYYSMTPAIVSRCLVFEFRALSEEDIAEGLERALKSPKGLGNLNVELTEGALNQLVRLSGGDLRKAYNGLELAVLTTPRNADGKITRRKIAASQKKPLSGHSSYDMISAFIRVCAAATATRRAFGSAD
ncbi:MAG: replication-associated recombination protein A, partial [Christensenellales bacterium]